jgi:hypothetical protein
LLVLVTGGLVPLILRDRLLEQVNSKDIGFKKDQSAIMAYQTA